jgi:hypothetical protein
MSSTTRIREEEEHHTLPGGEEEQHHASGRNCSTTRAACQGERVLGAPHVEEEQLELLHFEHSVGDG